MTGTVVDRLYGEFSNLINLLERAGEISLRSTVDDNFRKSLLMTAASYFEHRMVEVVLLFVSKATNNHVLITSLVQNKAVSRQYHTWFDWNARNANTFFGMFGNSFLDFMKENVKKNAELKTSIRAFLELGSDRNRLVHQNFGSFSLEKTSEEIYVLYTRAMTFIDALPDMFLEFAVVHAVEKDLPEKRPQQADAGVDGGNG